MSTEARHTNAPVRQATAGGTMADLDVGTGAGEELREMGPIDYVVLEWPGQQPDGEAAPLIIDLVDRGIIRLLDVAFMAKDENGVVFALDLSELAAYEAFAGASSGLLSTEDL